MMKPTNKHINYIEFKAIDLEKTKVFYNKVFGWEFTDYGPTYIAFENSGVAGGFEKIDAEIINGVLVVLYHDDLDAIKQHVIAANGKISVDTFSFPGGKRFQFFDPSGNELAVWCYE
ncbi:VOC family protein [Oceanihabitans sp. 2_MG-2023]|uniref:VOC family protein n=1 Tax=Oceanihabitans sp. 2_MG-2023 TaxID=3062661 RepID=UPI0026E20BC9|nr:VOC family protein [Oceanihabitans sp. 2_MG-2023]MDO6596917.1 VOC family protein [Oceanihabitans sp. 2_MG-2023]